MGHVVSQARLQLSAWLRPFRVALCSGLRGVPASGLDTIVRSPARAGSGVCEVQNRRRRGAAGAPGLGPSSRQRPLSAAPRGGFWPVLIEAGRGRLTPTRQGCGAPQASTLRDTLVRDRGRAPGRACEGLRRQGHATTARASAATHRPGTMLDTAGPNCVHVRVGLPFRVPSFPLRHLSRAGLYACKPRLVQRTGCVCVWGGVGGGGGGGAGEQSFRRTGVCAVAAQLPLSCRPVAATVAAQLPLYFLGKIECASWSRRKYYFFLF